MKKLILLTFVIAASFYACQGDNENDQLVNVNLNFRAVYNGEPLVMISGQYTYPDGKPVKFQTFNFYVSDVVLIGEDGVTETPLVDIDFIDFSENTTPGEAARPVTIGVEKINPGTYKGLRIGFGVPAELNNAQANQLEAGHPLRETYSSHFWSDWGSFIFMKLEGVYDKDGNGFDGNDPGFGHHTGTNAVYRTVLFEQPLVLNPGESMDLNLVVDARKFYEQNDSFLDFSNPANLYTHNPNDLTIANYIVDNFANAVLAAW
ncbi:MAG: hypothetical protein RI973_1088 [Bacteroidota bacterium]|jgi:hypothetical protein